MVPKIFLRLAIFKWFSVKMVHGHFNLEINLVDIKEKLGIFETSE